MPDLDPGFEYQAIRDEIRAEHTLIANRLSWYVTSQSFLVTTFVISQGNGFLWFRWFSTVLLPIVGFTCSALIFPSILGAVSTITLWHQKQKEFFERNAAFKNVFFMQRPTWVERRGLLFPQILPLLFGLVWIVVLVGSRLR
jgi:hypothetical protein